MELRFHKLEWQDFISSNLWYTIKTDILLDYSRPKFLRNVVQSGKHSPLLKSFHRVQVIHCTFTWFGQIAKWISLAHASNSQKEHILTNLKPQLATGKLKQYLYILQLQAI